MKGVFPWLDDRARGHRYRPDYSALTMLQVGKPEKITLPLNAVYRFDEPGHHTVRLETGRVGRGGVADLKPFGQLTTNAVAFEVEPMSEDEESAKASRFEQEIREELDVRPAQKFADEV